MAKMNARATSDFWPPERVVMLTNLLVPLKLTKTERPITLSSSVPDNEVDLMETLSDDLSSNLIFEGKAEPKN
jgi:hypothetical protein